jgi:hypothetical protein
MTVMEHGRQPCTEVPKQNLQLAKLDTVQLSARLWNEDELS